MTQPPARTILIVVAIALVAALALWRPWAETALIGNPEFDGIKLNERNTSVIIIHGIGDHCIGYADTLVSSLFMQEMGKKTESITLFHKREQKRKQELDRTQKIAESSEPAPAMYKVGFIGPLRDGSCRVVPGSDNHSGGDDLASITLAQEALCRSIHEDKTPGGEGDVDIDCHKLYVKKDPRLIKPEKRAIINREYITGFIRRFSANLTAGTRLNVYEVTWSPATRWIKQSLNDLEKFNNAESQHGLNRLLKSTIVNAGMADAVAYLSDSGILVNFDILQAFCMTFANNGAPFEGFAFACDQEQLGKGTDTFSKDNDVFLISHSLGTRVLFDSLGMLALGAPGRDSPAENRPSLMEAFQSKFANIGAEIPPSYTPDFARDLGERIPEFAKSVRSIYTFTNQVPLLAANLSSPFRRTSEAGMGFQDFLSLRRDGSRDSRLQVVAFHDPDDVLSYDLGCWYYQKVLRRMARDVIEAQAEHLANEAGHTKDDDDWRQILGAERRALHESLFRDNCTNRKLSRVDRKLLEQIWAVDENPLKLVEASIRLKGFRVAGLFASPLDVHSNYFVDENVHRLLVEGNHPRSHE